MNKNYFTLPPYLKFTVLLLCISLLTLLVYFGQAVIIPLLLSLLFALLLRPAVFYLRKKLKFPHALAVLVPVVLSVVVLSAVAFFIFWQIADFMHDWQKVKYNLTMHFEHFQ